MKYSNSNHMQSTCCILVAAKKSVRNLVRCPMKMKVSPSCHFPLTKAEEGPKCISDMLQQQQQQVVTGSQPEQQPSNNIIIICIIISAAVVVGLIRNRLFYFILFCACLFLVFVVSSSFTHIIRAFHCRCRCRSAAAALPRLILAKYFDIFGFSVQFSSSSRLERFEFCVDASIEL